MTCRGKQTVGLVAAVLLLTGSIAGWSTPTINDSAQDTIGAAIAQEDGSTVTLTCAQVLWCGKSGQSFAVKMWSEASTQQPELLVVSTSQLPVHEYWTVDVTGTIQTLEGTTRTGAAFRQRVVVVAPENVQVYCDSGGKPYSFPIPKGMLDSLLTTRPLVAVSTATATLAGQLPVLPDNPDAPLPAPGSRDSIKTLPDGASVNVNGAVVTAIAGNRFCIERGDRSFGIWVTGSARVSKGSLVDIAGQMDTNNGARVVQADTVSLLDTDYPSASYFGMNNKHLHYGLDTTGLLVRVWGKVTYVDQGNRIFFIDDGSNLDGGNGHVGVKIYDLSTETLPTVDSYVAVNGASDAESPDIRVVWKPDSGISVYLQSLQQSGYGIVSGTIAAPGADGGSARIYCGSSSTTATFVNGTAHYTLTIPYGSHAVTTTTTGYKTTTKLVRLRSTTTDATCDFSLPTIGRRVDIMTASSVALVDGSRETEVTAIVRDEEGRRLIEMPVTWRTSRSTIVSSGSITDAVGEARAVIRSLNSDSAAVVSAQVDQASAESTLQP